MSTQDSRSIYEEIRSMSELEKEFYLAGHPLSPDELITLGKIPVDAHTLRLILYPPELSATLARTSKSVKP